MKIRHGDCNLNKVDQLVTENERYTGRKNTKIIVLTDKPVPDCTPELLQHPILHWTLDDGELSMDVGYINWDLVFIDGYHHKLLEIFLQTGWLDPMEIWSRIVQ